MERRDFLASSIAAGAAVAGVGSLNAAPTSRATAKGAGRFKLNYAPHFGMFSSHAKDDLDQVSFAGDEGFTAWEDNGMRWRDEAFHKAFAERMAKHNMRMGIFVAQDIDWEKPTLTTGDQGIREKFVKQTGESCELCKKINAKWVTTVVGRVSQHLPWGHQFANVVETLRRAAEACEKSGSGMVMVIEPLNWRDHPGQFCATSDTLRALCRAVDSPHLKILQDLYHLQVTEGNLIDNMNRSWDDIEYFQLGDNPGRAEPGTGEVNYRNVFKHIQSRGFTGILGMEHGNSKGGSKEGERSLINAYLAADSGQ
ncbi:MAG: TIM barrel protein [Phycisphaerales bacterium]|nr:TIM barrel protein [Phycisphaerales bacterium]